MLRVNEDEYLPWIGEANSYEIDMYKIFGYFVESASVNTFIQQKNEHIFPNSVHYSTPPGNKAQFTLRKVQKCVEGQTIHMEKLSQRINTRLGDVYGTCANRTSGVHTFYYPGIYTVIVGKFNIFLRNSKPSRAVCRVATRTKSIWSVGVRIPASCASRQFRYADQKKVCKCQNLRRIPWEIT